MRIAICEDNQVEAGEIKRILEKWASETGTDVSAVWYPAAEAFWFDYGEESFDAVFLDIQMPGEDGITLAGKLRETGDQVPLIFVTGMDEYMSEGYEVEALHYLLKPVQEEKMIRCLERICQKRQQSDPVILLHTEDGLVKLQQKMIIKIEVYGRECVYTTSNGNYKTVQTMKEAQRNLPGELFIPCYRGVLVNLQYVEAIHHNRVVLAEGMTAPVSRRMYSDLNQAFIRFYRS